MNEDKFLFEITAHKPRLGSKWVSYCEIIKKMPNH